MPVLPPPRPHRGSVEVQTLITFLAHQDWWSYVLTWGTPTVTTTMMTIATTVGVLLVLTAEIGLTVWPLVIGEGIDTRG